MARKQVTLSRGGTAERTVYVDEIRIPDLWHAIQAIRAGQTYPKSQRDEVADAVMECWNLAHCLKREIE